MKMTDDYDPDLNPQVRIALVLYGGISLAVYMFGVVYEFWRLLRAARDRATEGPYADLLRDARATVAVDIVTGASAGGINAVLLAKALATGGDLSGFREFWINQADFLRLLREPGDREARSFLRIEAARRDLLKRFAAMDRGEGPLVDVLDLLVSGTRFRGRVVPFRDDMGQALLTRDHRKMFNLKLRTAGYNQENPRLGKPRNDFTSGRPGNPSANELLADIAVATGAFPGAIEPVMIDLKASGRDVWEGDWPHKARFFDGGILNNKPFGHAISTIFTRAADREVRRWLIGVQPVAEEADAGEDDPPELPAVLLAGGSQIPLYQSIAPDIQRLQARNRKVEQVAAALCELEAELAKPEVPAPPADLAALRALRRTHARDDLENRLLVSITRGQTSEPDEAFYRDLRGRVEEGVSTFDAAHGLPAFDEATDLRRVYHLLFMLDAKCGRLKTIGECDPCVPAPTKSDYARWCRGLWARLDEIRTLMRTTFERPEIRGLAGTPLSDLPIAVNSVLESLARDVATGLDQIREATLADCRQIDQELGGTAFAPMVRIFDDFARRDVYLVTLDTLGDLGARDPITFWLFGPREARYIERTWDEKLCGDTLGHWGGFLEERWRRNDIMWGRLDAAEAIVRVMLRGDRKAEKRPGEPSLTPAETQHMRAIQQEIVDDERPKGWTPGRGDYKDFLEKTYKVGQEGIGDLPGSRLVELGFRAADTMRDVLRRQQRSAPWRSLRGLAARAATALVGGLLALVRWPGYAFWGVDNPVLGGLTWLFFAFFVIGILASPIVLLWPWRITMWVTVWGPAVIPLGVLVASGRRRDWKGAGIAAVGLAVVLAPALVLWGQRPPGWISAWAPSLILLVVVVALYRTRQFERMMLLVLMLVVAVVLTGYAWPALATIWTPSSVPWLMLPYLAWVVFRERPWMGLASALVLAVIAAWGRIAIA